MSHSYTLVAPAKINLYLEIIGDRPDGYHELALILQSIDLADRVDLQLNRTGNISVRCDHPQVPNDRTNLAYRAAELMKQQFPEACARHGGVEITLHKRIPVAAGLAGGSSNAAAVLVGLDLLWELGLVQSELQELGARLGSDVPFCIAGGTVLATGRGENLSPLPDLDGLYAVLGKYNNLSVSTVWAYQTFRKKFSHTYLSDAANLEARWHEVHSSPLVSAIAHRDGAQIARTMRNDLEKVVLPEHAQVERLRQAFQDAGVLGTMMSGSGPTVFGLTESRAAAEQVQATVAQTMSDPELNFWIAQLTPIGIHIAR